MEEALSTPLQDTSKEEKKKKKAEKEDLFIEKLMLAYERTLIAWIKAATHILFFGFAIYKLLESKMHEPGEHYILQVLTPRVFAAILFLSGFFSLLMATIRFAQVQKRFTHHTWATYFKPIFILAYVILFLLGLLTLGLLLGR